MAGTGPADWPRKNTEKGTQVDPPRKEDGTEADQKQHGEEV